MQAQRKKTAARWKRKSENDNDSIPRKKVQIEHSYTVKRHQTKYQAPKGVRKSDRIAGRPADSLDPLPRGQYNRCETNPGVSADPVSGPHSVSAEGTPSESLERDSVSEDNAVDAQRIRPRSFLEVVVATLSFHKIVRRLVDGSNKWVARADFLECGQHGVIKLKDQLQEEERDANATENLTRLCDQYAAKLQQLEECERVISRLRVPIQDLRIKHANHNNWLYDYINVTQGEAELQCLPAEFWTAFRRCCEAYTRCRDIELDMHEAEQEQLKLFQEVETRMLNAVCRKVGQGTDSGQTATFDDPVVTANARISALGGHSATLSRLNVLLKAAKAAQYKEEAKLHDIAEDAFVEAGYLHAETDIDKSRLRWRLWVTSDKEEEAHSEGRGAGNTTTSGVRPTSRKRPNRLLFEVKSARMWLKDCCHKLDDSRRAPVSNAGSLNSTGQGEARFRRMKRLTQEVRDAELEYRSVLRRAQNARTISESDQSSNFQDHESDGYSDATLKLFGYPMPTRKKQRVHKWIENMSQSGKGQQVRADRQGSDSSTEGSWINRVDSMVFGEDIEVKVTDRRKDRIEAWDKERQRLRLEGAFEQAENDFHPQNRV